MQNEECRMQNAPSVSPSGFQLPPEGGAELKEAIL